jgi:hypothetical protein
LEKKVEKKSCTGRLLSVLTEIISEKKVGKKLEKVRKRLLLAQRFDWNNFGKKDHFPPKHVQKDCKDWEEIENLLFKKFPPKNWPFGLKKISQKITFLTLKCYFATKKQHSIVVATLKHSTDCTLDTYSFLY